MEQRRWWSSLTWKWKDKRTYRPSRYDFLGWLPPHFFNHFCIEIYIETWPISSSSSLCSLHLQVVTLRGFWRSTITGRNQVLQYKRWKSYRNIFTCLKKKIDSRYWDLLWYRDFQSVKRGGALSRPVFVFRSLSGGYGDWCNWRTSRLFIPSHGWTSLRQIWRGLSSWLPDGLGRP